MSAPPAMAAATATIFGVSLRPRAKLAGAGGEPVQAVHGDGYAAACRAVRLALLDGPGPNDGERRRRAGSDDAGSRTAP
jgi:hypothetical protein